MVRRKVIITTHGGYREKLEYPYKEQRLLDTLWEKAGNPGALGKVVNVLPQALGGWRRSGFVPLNKVGPIARALNVPIYALNFTGCHDLLGKGPSWEDMLDKCRLSEAERRYINAGVSLKK